MNTIIGIVAAVTPQCIQKALEWGLFLWRKQPLSLRSCLTVVWNAHGVWFGHCELRGVKFGVFQTLSRYYVLQLKSKIFCACLISLWIFCFVCEVLFTDSQYFVDDIIMIWTSKLFCNGWSFNKKQFVVNQSLSHVSYRELEIISAVLFIQYILQFCLLTRCNIFSVF